jgi:hypothetical protein
MRYRLIVLGLLFLLEFLSCSPVDRFSEYEGVNLLETVSLAEWTPDFNATSPYMLYESAGPVGPEGQRRSAFEPRTCSPTRFRNGTLQAGLTTTAPFDHQFR